MKNRVTKCLVMGALAIGMSSTVMAEEEVVKTSHTHKYQPVAYSATEDDNSAIALLLVNDKGQAHGLTCTNKGQALFAAGDCSRVDGQVSRYEGIIAYDLSGVKFEGNVLTRATLHIEQKNQSESVQAEVRFSYVKMPVIDAEANRAAQVTVNGFGVKTLIEYKLGEFVSPLIHNISYIPANNATYPACPANSTAGCDIVPLIACANYFVPSKTNAGQTKPTPAFPCIVQPGATVCSDSGSNCQ